MPIYELGEFTPRISERAFVHPDAVVIGDVQIGDLSSIWPGAVLRGDGGQILIGRRTSVQDNAVLHTTPEAPTVIGDGCVLGHQIHLEGCTIEDDVMIGNAAMVLHRCVVRSGSVVAANSVLLNGMEVPRGALAAGTPAVIKPSRARLDEIRESAQGYVDRIDLYRSGLRRIG